MAHPWLQKGEFATEEEVRAEFLTRHNANKEISRQESERKQAMKTHISNQARRGDTVGNKTYRWIADPDLTDEERNDPDTVLLKLKDYQEGAN